MFLLDTNAIIHFLHGHSKLTQKLNEHLPVDIKISFVSVGELIFGAYHSQYIEKNLLVIHELCEKIEVIHSTISTATTYGKLKNLSLQKKKFPGDHDLWIAATALEKKATLITQNTKHFSWIEELKVTDWTKS